MKHLILSFLLMVPLVSNADSVLSIKGVGKFSVIPEPVTCTGANDKLIWNNGWRCAKDRVNDIKPNPFSIAFRVTQAKPATAYWGSRRDNIAHAMALKGGAYHSRLVPVRSVKREVCGGRPKRCNMDTVWDPIDPRYFEDLINGNYYAWKGMDHAAKQHNAYGYSNGTVIGTPYN